MKDFWRRVGGPHAINWLSVAWGYPTLLVINFIGSGISPHHSLWFLAAASTVGAMSLFAFLFLARFTILRGAAKRPLPAATFLVILVGLFIRALTFDLMLTELGLQATEHLAYRFFASIPTIGLTLVLMAYIMSLAKDYSSTYRRLVETNASLIDSTATLDANIRAKREDVVGSIRRELEARLRQLSGVSANQALKRWRDIIEDVVRPVSHDLARQVTDLSPLRADRKKDSVIWRRVFTDSTAEQPFRPFAFSFWSGFATICFAPLVWGWAKGFELALVASLVPFALLSAFAYLWPRRLKLLNVPVRSVTFSVMLIVTATLTSLALEQVHGLEVIAERSLVPMMVLWVFLGWGIAIIPSLQFESRRVLDSLEESSMQLREEMVRLNTAYRLQQQAIARALHGPIQDALSLAAFQLAKAMENGKATPALIERLNGDISKTLTLLDADASDALKIGVALGELAEFWDGVARISWKLAPGVAPLLDQHPTTAATAFELVREACSNAVRHGRATQIKALVALSQDKTRLLISVSNNGTLVALSTKPGLGTRLMNELALSWSLRAEGGKTLLEAETPVI